MSKSVARASGRSYLADPNRRSPLSKEGRVFNRILVPTDGSDAAAAAAGYAIRLSSIFDSTLVGLHVVDVRLIEDVADYIDMARGRYP